MEAVAIVSGGSGGIGRELVRRLAGRRIAVVVVYLDDQQRAEAAVEEVVATRGTAVAVRADLADELDVERLFTEAAALFGAVDIVVHTMTQGAHALYQHAVRHLRRGGAVVSVCTGDAIAPSLAEQLRERDITINGVPAGLEAPGPLHDLGELLALLDRWRDRLDV
jgi:3-oxoacyl-[acyl-carrier protein] reductase